MTRVLTTKLLLLVGVAAVAACSSSRRIDGTSAASFERSVAMLQNDLPSRRREDLDLALAIIWTRAAGLRTDVDQDGDVDYLDARVTADAAGDLLSAIQLGDLVSRSKMKVDPLPPPISSSSTDWDTTRSSRSPGISRSGRTSRI